MVANYSATDCDLAHQLNNDFLFLLSLFYTSIVSLIATPLLAYFIRYKLWVVKFDNNLKLMLIFYFGSLMLFSMGLCVGFGYRFLVSFFIAKDCDLLIEPTFFKFYHLSLLSLMTFSMLLPIGFSIERCVALKYAEKYEHSYKWLGAFLVSILFVCEVLMIWLIYKDEAFFGPHYAIVLVPTTSASRFNVFFYFFIGVQLFTLISILIIINQHKRIENNYLKKNHSLSLRFVLLEIYDASKLVLVVSFIHVIFVGCYVVGGLAARLLGPTYFANMVNYTIARAVYCSVPTYNLIIPMIGCYLLNKQEKNRKKSVNTTIRMKSTGDEGMKNYHDVINRSWEKLI